MIVFPINWKKNYEELCVPKDSIDVDIPKIIDIIHNTLKEIGVFHLAYSGGIDSTLMLLLLSKFSRCVNTYTISNRVNHPDISFASFGSSFFKSNHTEFIIKEDKKESDIFQGDNCVRQFFENVSQYTDKIICCDGIDEFMCGYYDHIPMSQERYYFYLSRLLPNHLIPLDKNSGNVEVYLPYLDDNLIDVLKNIALDKKVFNNVRKKIMVDIGYYYNQHNSFPESIIKRKKYGFCDAFIEKNK